MPYKDIEKRRENQRLYYQRHREERLAYRKSRRVQDREIWRNWANRNPEKRMEHLVKYKANHPEYAKVYSQRKYIALAKELPQKCAFCGSLDNLQVHHKDGDKTNDALPNLQILCQTCHQSLHS